jgi:hypothetical protein
MFSAPSSRALGKFRDIGGNCPRLARLVLPCECTPAAVLYIHEKPTVLRRGADASVLRRGADASVLRRDGGSLWKILRRDGDAPVLPRCDDDAFHPRRDGDALRRYLQAQSQCVVRMLNWVGQREQRQLWRGRKYA